jgi:hypothetical protein
MGRFLETFVELRAVEYRPGGSLNEPTDDGAGIVVIARDIDVVGGAFRWRAVRVLNSETSLLQDARDLLAEINRDSNGVHFAWLKCIANAADREHTVALLNRLMLGEQ